MYLLFSVYRDMVWWHYHDAPWPLQFLLVLLIEAPLLAWLLPAAIPRRQRLLTALALNAATFAPLYLADQAWLNRTTGVPWLAASTALLVVLEPLLYHLTTHRQSPWPTLRPIALANLLSRAAVAIMFWPQTW